MSAANQDALWTVVTPAVWPEPSEEMAVSTLAEIEACPRRWSLSSAEYPGVWAGHGYPPPIQLYTLAGTVVHLALEAVTRALILSRCSSLQDAAAIQVMRNLGGYTKIVNDAIDQVLKRFAGNPRAARLLEHAARVLRGKIADLRTQAQILLGYVNLPLSSGSGAPSREPDSLLNDPPVPRDAATPNMGGPSRPAALKGSAFARRKPLPSGAHPEITLRAKHIGWKGKVDLLLLRDETCKIIDFKTGAQKDEHRFQIRVYALLWSRDDELNPTRRLADRLSLAYKDGDVEVPAPSAIELDTLERELVVRRDAARRAVAVIPPEARPSVDNCPRCWVRHLCDKYWTEETQRSLNSAVDGQQYTDFELVINSWHGPSSWDATVEVSGAVLTGKRVVLRSTRGTQDFRPGDRVRVLNTLVAIEKDDERQPAVVTMATFSEVFTMPQIA